MALPSVRHREGQPAHSPLKGATWVQSPAGTCLFMPLVSAYVHHMVRCGNVVYSAILRDQSMTNFADVAVLTLQTVLYLYKIFRFLCVQPVSKTL